MRNEDLMPEFTYSGDDSRYYPSLALAVEPGDTVTLDSDPGDGRFTAKGVTPVAAVPATDLAPVSAPADIPEVGN
jgi:hypothetical protein